MGGNRDPVMRNRVKTADETKPASVENKFKSEDMARVRQRKEFLWTEVANNDPTSLVDHLWWDHIKTDRWECIAGVFPQGDKCSTKHKWVLMTEDTKSLVPYRYQQYDITVKLNPDKEDKLHSTFGNLPKTYPTLWI
jgi:hypothetical protein